MKESGATKNLFEDEGDVFNLQIALKKIPEKVSEKPVRAPLARARAMRRTAPASSLHSACHLRRTCNTTHQVRIELPYSLFPSNGEVCLIVKDPQRVYKDRVRSRAPA